MMARRYWPCEWRSDDELQQTSAGPQTTVHALPHATHSGQRHGQRQNGPRITQWHMPHRAQSPMAHNHDTSARKITTQNLEFPRGGG